MSSNAKMIMRRILNEFKSLFLIVVSRISLFRNNESVGVQPSLQKVRISIARSDPKSLLDFFSSV